MLMQNKFLSSRKFVPCLANMPKINKILNIFLSVIFQRLSELLGPNDALILGVSIQKFTLHFLLFICLIYKYNGNIFTKASEIFTLKVLNQMLCVHDWFGAFFHDLFKCFTWYSAGNTLCQFPWWFSKFLALIYDIFGTKHFFLKHRVLLGVEWYVTENSTPLTFNVFKILTLFREPILFHLFLNDSLRITPFGSSLPHFRFVLKSNYKQ